MKNQFVYELLLLKGFGRKMKAHWCILKTMSPLLRLSTRCFSTQHTNSQSTAALLAHFQQNPYPSLSEKSYLCHKYNISLEKLNQFGSQARQHNREFSLSNRRRKWNPQIKSYLIDNYRKQSLQELIQFTGLSKRQIIAFYRRYEDQNQPISEEKKSIVKDFVTNRMTSSTFSITKDDYVHLKQKTNLSMLQLYRLVHFFRHSTDTGKHLSSHQKRLIRQEIHKHCLSFRNDNVIGPTRFSSDISWTRHLWRHLRQQFPHSNPFSLYRYAYRYVVGSGAPVQRRTKRNLRVKHLLSQHRERLETLLRNGTKSFDSMTLDEKRKLCDEMQCTISQLNYAVQILSDQLFITPEKKQQVYTWMQQHNFPRKLTKGHMEELSTLTTLSRRQLLELHKLSEFPKSNITKEKKELIREWWLSRQTEKIANGSSKYPTDENQRTDDIGEPFHNIPSSLMSRTGLTRQQIQRQIRILNDPRGTLTREKKKLLLQRIEEREATSPERHQTDATFIRQLAQQHDLSTRQVRHQLSLYRIKRQTPTPRITDEKRRQIEIWMKQIDFQVPSEEQYQALQNQLGLSRLQLQRQVRRIRAI